jgi:transposase
LGQAAEQSLAVKLVKLIIEPEETAGEQAQELITQARAQLTDTTVQQNLINLIETIIVYKLPQKSREEIAAMLNLSELKQTRFYQEVKQEGIEEGREEGREEGEQKAKLEAIPRLLVLGLSVEQIARALDISIEVVQQIADRLQRRWNIFPKQNIGTLIELLTQQRSLFTAEQLLAIAQLIEPLADEVPVLSDAIFTWAENYPSIQEAQSTLLNASALNGLEEERSNAGNFYNKRSLKNAIFQTRN